MIEKTPPAVAPQTSIPDTSISDTGISDTSIIWDMPLRLFHWLLMTAVVVAIASIKWGNLFIHEKAGITVAGLVVFRIIWGFIGTHHARFSSFITGPRAVLAYIKGLKQGNSTHHAGHSPLGGWATMAILAVLAAMASLGLMANDSILYEAPLAVWVGEFSNTATTLHHYGERVVFAVIALHLVALLGYRLALKINLLPAMLFGGEDKARQAPSKTHTVLGVALLVAILALAHLLGMLGDRYY